MSVWKSDEKLLSICILNFSFKNDFVWEEISNIRHSVSSPDETPRSLSKILRCASYFQLSSQCFIWWWNTASHVWYITSHTGEKEAAMESLQQAITTLAVLDVTAGAVVQNPWTSLIANDISTKKQFKNVNKAIANYRDAISRGVSSPITNQDDLIREVMRKKWALDQLSKCS